MTNKPLSFINNIWIKLGVVVACFLIILHLSFFFILSRYSQKTEIEINRGIMARQIITLVQALQFNPPDKWNYIVDAINIPNVSMSLDDSPKYKVHVPEMEIWDILVKIHEIPVNAHSLDLSIKINTHRWLNISAIIVKSPLLSQAVLFSFELIIIIAVLMIIWLINRYNIPLKRFVKAVEKINVAGDMIALSENDGPQTVRDAAKAINQMQTRIKELIKDRTQMFAAISHDLRTPITRIKLRAHFINDEEQQQKIIHDLDEMESMINESLAYFRDGQQPLKKSSIDLTSLLSSLCNEYQETQRHVTFLTKEKNRAYFGNALALKRAFSNIIDNALKYGANPSVELEFCEPETEYATPKIIITISDEGPGIPQDELSKVFTAFYRGEQSRSRSTGGIGLGLAAARNIIEAHQGDIQLSNRQEGGLLVTITLPLLKNHNRTV